METTRDDQVIYLKDLIFAALYQWRKILCLAVIFAVLLGGFQAIKLMGQDMATQEAYEAELQKYEEDLAACQENIDTITNSIEIQNTYLRESVLMKLNPYRICAGTIAWNITPEDPEQLTAAVTLLKAYSRILEKDDTLTAASEALEIDPAYLRELISYEYVVEGTLLTLTAIGDDETTVEQLMNTLSNHIIGNYQQVEAGVGAHTVTEVARGVSYKTKLDLVGQKKNAESYLKTLEDSLKTAESAKNALVHPESSMLTPKTMVVKIVKFAIIGGVLGAVLMAGIAVALHIFRKRVYSVRTLKNRTGIKVLGCVPAEGKKNPIDKWLMKLEGRTVEENLPFLTANLQNYYRNAKKILVTGIDTDQGENVARYLTQAGMPGVYCGSLTKDADAVAALAECDGVLMVAEYDRSCYAGIRECGEMVCSGTTVGCILVNG